MYYWELYKEYLREVDILSSYIKSLKEKSKNTPLNQKENLKRRISILYDMYRDMKETTEYLYKRCGAKTYEKKIYISKRFY